MNWKELVGLVLITFLLGYLTGFGMGIKWCVGKAVDLFESRGWDIELSINQIAHLIAEKRGALERFVEGTYNYTYDNPEVVMVEEIL